MSETYEFGSLEAANAARDEFDDWVCPADDDRRLTRVAFVSDTPDDVRERIDRQAADARDVQDAGAGQVPLTDEEKNQIDFSETNVLHARSAKGIARSEGVDDWLSWYDPDLSVDEHREVYENAKTQEQGRRLDAADDPDAKAGEAARTAASEECDHARDHCEHGDPDACEFLQEACGMDEDEVAAILDDETGAPEKGELPGKVYGALEQLWTQYRAGLGQAKEAAAGINEIRTGYGQAEMAFEELGDREITREDVS